MASLSTGTPSRDGQERLVFSSPSPPTGGGGTEPPPARMTKGQIIETVLIFASLVAIWPFILARQDSFFEHVAFKVVGVAAVVVLVAILVLRWRRFRALLDAGSGLPEAADRPPFVRGASAAGPEKDEK